jgi:hypothetical protein
MISYAKTLVLAEAWHFWFDLVQGTGFAIQMAGLKV